MRISDWSSDVCSSELGESAMLTGCMLGQTFGVLVFIEELAELVTANAVRHGLSSRFGGAQFTGFPFHDVLEGFNNPGPLIDRFRAAARRLIDNEIGRSSCRERVCQSVYILVGP